MDPVGDGPGGGSDPASLERRDALKLLTSLGVGAALPAGLSGQAAGSGAVPAPKWTDRHLDRLQHQEPTYGKEPDRIIDVDHVRTSHDLSYFGARWDPFISVNDETRGGWKHTFALGAHGLGLLEQRENGETTDVYPGQQFTGYEFTIEGGKSGDATIGEDYSYDQDDVAWSLRYDEDTLARVTGDAIGRVLAGEFDDEIAAATGNPVDMEQSVREYVEIVAAGEANGYPTFTDADAAYEAQFDLMNAIATASVLGFLEVAVSPGVPIAVGIAEAAIAILHEYIGDEELSIYEGLHDGFDNVVPSAGAGSDIIFDVYVAPGEAGLFTVESSFKEFDHHKGHFYDALEAENFLRTPRWQVYIPPLDVPGDDPYMSPDVPQRAGAEVEPLEAGMQPGTVLSSSSISVVYELQSTALVGEDVTFQADVSLPDDARSSEYEYTWDFGNGERRPIQRDEVTYTYGEAGDMETALTVTGPEQSDSHAQTLLVFPDPKLDAGDRTTRVNKPLLISYDGGAYDPKLDNFDRDLEKAAFLAAWWVDGELHQIDNTLTPQRFRFDEPGTYTVEFLLWADGYEIATETIPIEVLERSGGPPDDAGPPEDTGNGSDNGGGPPDGAGSQSENAGGQSSEDGGPPDHAEGSGNRQSSLGGWLMDWVS